MNERINAPISMVELQRRWSAIRAVMRDARVDVLVTQANNDFVGGYVKYLTDMPATNGYYYTVIFPQDAEIAAVAQGAFGQDEIFDRLDASPRRGVQRLMGVPSYASVHFASTYDAECALKALGRYNGATIGLLGTGSMSYAFVAFLQKHLTKSIFVDASHLVDPIKAVKSAEEISLIRRMAALQDACAEAVTKNIRPGLRDSEVVEIARNVATQLGSEQGWYMAASGPVGTATVMQPPHMQNRVLREGDQFCLLIENSGPGGFYGEIGRTWVLGKASQEMKDEFAFVLEAQKFTLELLNLGADPADIFARYNDFMRAGGRPQENRLYAHGQGYDMVERPLIRHDETLKVGPNMLFAVHPTYLTQRSYCWICDNYLVHESGDVESLHKFPQQITEL
jgi:Xaa-Pro aminopeptidase